jgi:hypothetical protein
VTSRKTAGDLPSNQRASCSVPSRALAHSQPLQLQFGSGEKREESVDAIIKILKEWKKKDVFD